MLIEQVKVGILKV